MQKAAFFCNTLFHQENIISRRFHYLFFHNLSNYVLSLSKALRRNTLSFDSGLNNGHDRLLLLYFTFRGHLEDTFIQNDLQIRKSN